MGNEFSKLSSSILNRALSRFGSKPATSLGSKAKAAIGLGGLAGAGALAHHYDMLLPNRVTSQLANEVVAPTSMPASVRQVVAPTSIPASVRQVANEAVPTTAPSISAAEPASSIIEAATAPTTVNAASIPESNARQVLSAINSQPSNAAAETPDWVASRPSTVTEDQLEGYNKRKNRLMMGPTEEAGRIQAELNLLRSRVAKPDIFTDPYEGPFRYNSSRVADVSYPERYLTALVNLRDEAAFLGDTKSIPEINRLIDGFSKSLDEGSRAYAYSLEDPHSLGYGAELNDAGIYEYNKSGYPEVLHPLIGPYPKDGYIPYEFKRLPGASYIKKILGYDSNPWGIGANSSSIPIDTEMGRLRVSGNPSTLRSTPVLYGDPNELQPMDYDSYLKQVHEYSDKGKYIDSQEISRLVDSSIDDVTNYSLEATRMGKLKDRWMDRLVEHDEFIRQRDAMMSSLASGEYSGRHNIAAPLGSAFGLRTFPDMSVDEFWSKYRDGNNNVIDYYGGMTQSPGSGYPTRGMGMRDLPTDTNLTREYYKYLKDGNKDMNWEVTSPYVKGREVIDLYGLEADDISRIPPYSTAHKIDIADNSPALEYPSLSVASLKNSDKHLPGYKELGTPRYQLNNYRPNVKLPELRPVLSE